MSDTSKLVAELGPSRPMQVRSSFRRSAQGREIVIVLGMHRSGTSLLANVLHLLGVDMVDEPPHASPSNEKGFWERPDIRAIHDEILAVLGVPVGSTAHAVPFAAGWWRSVEIKKLKEQLRDLLATHLAQVRRPWGFKDPRTCRLLPLWGEILEELDVSPRFVWAVRHPAESALSMTMKNPVHRPIPVAQSEVMWLAYNYDILRYAGRHWPIIVPFDQWFEDPLAQAKELARELDLVWQGSDHELQSALAHLVSGESRHHQVSDGKLRCNLAISEEIYRSILGIRNGEASEVSEASAVSLHSLLMAVQPFAIAAKEAKALKDENQKLSKDIERLHADTQERDRLKLSLAEVSSERDGLSVQLASARAAAEALHGEHAAAARKMDSVRNQLATVSAAREKAEAALASAVAEMELLHTQGVEGARGRAELEASLAAALDEAASLKRDIAAASEAEAALEGEIARLRQEAAAAAEVRAALETELTSAAADAQSLRREVAGASEARAVLEGEVARLNDEVAALRGKLRAERERHAEAFQALLLKSRPSGQAKDAKPAMDS